MSEELQARVLLVAASPHTTGGGERHVADLLTLLPARGMDVTLVCPGGNGLPGIARSYGIEVIELDLAGGVSRRRVRELRGVLEQRGPDLVHAHGSRAAAFVRLADREASRRVLYTLHGIHIDQSGTVARRVLFGTLERRLRARTALFLTVCHSDAAKGARLGVLDSSRTVTVHNGIGPVRQAPQGVFRDELRLGGAAPLALSVGRFHEQKDQQALLRAWKTVVAQLPEARLAVIGDGPMKGVLETEIARLDLSGSASLLAPRQDLESAYADADLFVLSSRWEGLPYSIIEAMAHGLAVVSTDVDGVPEAVDNGVTGLLVPPSNPTTLADALIDLLRAPDRRSALGQAGRDRVLRDFRIDSMVDGVVAAYRRVLRSQRGPTDTSGT